MLNDLIVFLREKRTVLVQIAIAALSFVEPFLGFTVLETPFTHRVNFRDSIYDAREFCFQVVSQFTH